MLKLYLIFKQHKHVTLLKFHKKKLCEEFPKKNFNNFQKYS